MIEWVFMVTPDDAFSDLELRALTLVAVLADCSKEFVAFKVMIGCFLEIVGLGYLNCQHHYSVES